MIVEIINSAIEAVVDRIGPEHHELSGRAKDMGSAAVLLAIIIALIAWERCCGRTTAKSCRSCSQNGKKLLIFV
ncbi:diacylglycerol kinase [Klebsiella grimontii]|uniref:Diacylglycerol kinase n=1 Tax=Klebsiella grimontii TaxID=2058152 RepID=A0A7H4PC19_9ENTR|nr:diacylglycerol kinase [Klebsiella grimontii]